MVKIDFFRASKTNVKPGEKILISGLISSDIDSSYIVKLHIVGTNIKKQTIILDKENKEILLRKNKPQKISWNIEIPKDFNIRYNFIGYVQWISKKTKEAGILSSYLFSAGSTYDVEVLEEKLNIENNTLKGLNIHAINREIEPIDIKIPIIVSRNGTILYKETYEVMLNYEEIIEIDFTSSINAQDNIVLDYSIIAEETTIYEKKGIEVFPDYIPNFVKYLVEIVDNIPIEESNELSIYLKKDEKILSHKRYFDLNIYLLGKDKYLFSLNNVVIFGLNWNENINDNPLIYDSFKDFLFSYLYLTLFGGNFPKQIELWTMNKALVTFLLNSVEGKAPKLKKKIEKLNVYCDDIIEIYKQMVRRNYISSLQYKNLNILKKKYYRNFVKYKKEILGMTKKEINNIESAIDKINKEKQVFKKSFTKIYDTFEKEMKIRTSIAALRRFYSYRIKRDTNKAYFNQENEFAIIFKNESDYYSLSLKMRVESNEKIKIIEPKETEKNILILPNAYSGETEEKVKFALLDGKDYKNLKIKLIFDLGV